MLSRMDRSAIADWWWTVDRWILAACLLLMGAGILFSFAASPAVAMRVGIADNLHFVKLHVWFTLAAVPVMIGLSFFAPRSIRLFCLCLLLISLVLLVMTLFFGVETKGSRRWISLAGFGIQPSEFMKPAYVVVMAWLFARQTASGWKSLYLPPVLLWGLCAALLVAEPDLGQTLLITLVMGGLFFISGIPLWFVGLLGGLAVAGGFCAYYAFSHVHERIDGFLHGEGDTFQVDVGREAIMHGGWLGQGPGEGLIKRIIPDSHTDFVFSVIAEEYGIILSLVIIGLFAFIVLRSFYLAMRERDIFIRYAITGLVLLFGFQAIINLAVNLHLMPPKGMTLPFISYGGSSLIAIAIVQGCLLGLTRKRPEGRASLDFD
ncbi:FtsW/RodA/SpoVE family cell cycle protein [Candidatus Tokpelaia sp.]|uniref:FtsW/RodA/SpoVE family cell cycle protein n=1 Tax=Candidatus Tokpelaia sp. TaxID=2233777 RepID=UPI00123B5B41|nr:putative peptidoglycan glycosyltransferase FtsW [Candidatus Tokpelaia sp.]KAA6405862.1 cell division protein FtsW [Candidatus Tokpelaia sp.]